MDGQDGETVLHMKLSSGSDTSYQASAAANVSKKWVGTPTADDWSCEIRWTGRSADQQPRRAACASWKLRVAVGRCTTSSLEPQLQARH
mmetsp:Transcript_4719/g.10468  ORF Transcript_4719/g.10468 Transcript_4719/m.10468 type:complete len:89 (-) Transcript_4719:375-641(-)